MLITVFRVAMGRNQCFYVFNSHNKDGNDNISAAGTATLLKFESLSSLENYTLSVYYTNYPMTLYFQIQFNRVTCTLHVRNRVKNSIKIRRKNNIKSEKEYKRKKNQEKKVFNKVQKFHQQIREGPYYISEAVVRRCSSK